MPAPPHVRTRMATRLPPDPRPLAPLPPELPPLDTYPTHEAAVDEALRRFTTPPPTTRRSHAAPDRGRLPTWMRAADDTRLVRTAFGDVACWRWGAPDAPAIACIHGWGGRAAQWAPLIDAAITAGLQVVACDAPGHGASDGDDAAMPAFRDALLAAIDTWGVPLVGIVGHSLGGLAALAVVTALADRDPARAATLHVVSIGAPATVARPFDRFVVRHRASPAVTEAMLARFAARWGTPFPDLETDALAARCATLGALPALLVLHAVDDDQVLVAEAGYLASMWPGATLQLVERGGHSALLRDPAVVGAVLAAVRPR